MTRLQTELERLYLVAPAALSDPQGRVRALVLEVVLPASWDRLSAVWQGVQATLDLPAPAIAVSGIDAMQLWFSLEAPVAAAQGRAFLAGLGARWFADLPPAQVRLRAGDAALVPAPLGEDRWSAFVAPDLAAVFAETPWLDVEPGEEGQAGLLHGLRSIEPAAFADALARLSPPAGDAPAPEPARTDDPRAFLRRVMNDESVDLALRIEAAKALLR
jgi:hypothetical protein